MVTKWLWAVRDSHGNYLARSTYPGMATWQKVPRFWANRPYAARLAKKYKATLVAFLAQETVWTDPIG